MSHLFKTVFKCASAAHHSRVLATTQAQRPKSILRIEKHYRCTNYMYVSTELWGISIKVQIDRERRVGDEKMRPRPRSIMRYPRDSVSTTVERSDCVDNALRARYPTTNTLSGRGVMYRLISVRSGGQKCAEGIENAKHTSSSVHRVSNQISCTLYCDCRQV